MGFFRLVSCIFPSFFLLFSGKKRKTISIFFSFSDMCAVENKYINLLFFVTECYEKPAADS